MPCGPDWQSKQRVPLRIGIGRVGPSIGDPRRDLKATTRQKRFEGGRVEADKMVTTEVADKPTVKGTTIRNRNHHNATRRELGAHVVQGVIDG